jgi:hypothetical protein
MSYCTQPTRFAFFGYAYAGAAAIPEHRIGFRGSRGIRCVMLASRGYPSIVGDRAHLKVPFQVPNREPLRRHVTHTLMILSLSAKSAATHVRSLALHDSTCRSTPLQKSSQLARLTRATSVSRNQCRLSADWNLHLYCHEARRPCHSRLIALLQQ